MKYGLIGEKLPHSFSAEIHRQLFDYEYTLKELKLEELAMFLSHREFQAINVTIPYKEAVIPYLDHVDDVAAAIGAVNTIVCRDGKLYGYNTDVYGLCALIERSGISVAGKNVLILGSGGTSKTALNAVKKLGCNRVWRTSRTEKDGCISYEQAMDIASEVHVLINTTPCGMYPNTGESAVDISAFPALEGVVDVVYNPLRSKLVCDAMAHNIPATGGLYMLVAQAAAAAELFVGSPVPVDRIDEIYNRLYGDKQNIVLIGMPGCGKSSVGEALAMQLGFDFVDTDQWIVQQEGRSISDIFAHDGEIYFREVEKAIVHRVATLQHTVIATGGGAVLNEENVALLRENGRLYFLDRALERLVTTDDRPLSSNRIALEQRYAERYPLYCRLCDVRIQADGTVNEVVECIRKEIAYDEA